MQALISVRRAVSALLLGLSLSFSAAFVAAEAQATSLCGPSCSAPGDAIAPETIRPANGTALKVRTGGSIRILGGFTTSGGDVRIRAENTLTVDVPDLDFEGINLFLTGENNVEMPSPPVAPPSTMIHPSIVERGGTISISADGEISLASAESGQLELGVRAIVQKSGTSESESDDVFEVICLHSCRDLVLDLTGLTLAEVDIAAGEDIVWSAPQPTLVPEPGTALLVGLGLVLLGGAHRRPQAHATCPDRD